MRLLTNILLSARMHFEVKRMVFLFFPPMRVFAPVLMFAAVSIGWNKVLCFPIWALVFFIVINMRFSSEILPVVGIYTSVSRMRSITVRTPYCLKMEHVEILIFLKLIKKIYSNFGFRVRKSTHVPIVATFNLSRVSLTKLNFIFFRMIELLYSIVRSRASVTIRALLIWLATYHITANFTWVGA